MAAESIEKLTYGLLPQAKSYLLDAATLRPFSKIKGIDQLEKRWVKCGSIR